MRNAENAFMRHVQILVKKYGWNMDQTMDLGIAKTECGLCSGVVLNDHNAVQCDKCEMWVHNDCSFVTGFQYETMQNSSCTLLCPNVIFSTSQIHSFLSS